MKPVKALPTIYEYLSLSSKISIASTRHEVNISFYQTETMTRNHNQSICRIVETSPIEYICKTFSLLQLRNIAESIWIVKSQRFKEFAVRICLLVTSEARTIKSHQHGCQTRSEQEWGQQTWIGKSPWSLIPNKELQETE